MYIAHLREDQEVQSVASHSSGTARRCARFAVAPWKPLAYTMALYHDIGKYQPSFQRYIQGKGSSIPHALCGVQELRTRLGSSAPALIMQYAIAGHHGGLPDYGTKLDTPAQATLSGTLRRDCEAYDVYRQELAPPEIPLGPLSETMGAGCRTPAEAAERFAFFTRYLFSCLTDADWLDTEAFCVRQERTPLTADFPRCLEKVDRVLAGFQCQTAVQKKRALLQEQVFKKVGCPGQVFLMNMPTGSGKTLASIKFALEQAIALQKQRIIYIIPYNSIIDQTAEVLGSIFGEDAAILRHQSSYVLEEDGSQSEQDKLMLKQATENWDAQIVLTTAVQFFESVYSNRRSKLRKLHNMANSILVFDEAHLMPPEYLQPCFSAVAHITKFLNTQALFLTATMPNFPALFADLTEETAMVDLVPDKTDFSAFQRCGFQSLGEVSDEALLLCAQAHPSTLIVVNRRGTAQALFRAAPEGERYHLSTYMTARDRAAVIARIKARVRQLELDFPDLREVPPQRRILVVSTSLVEAGVDLDFTAVYRELWGLDSILQSGGRCNREGKLDSATVYIFQRRQQSTALPAAVSITKGLLAQYEDISSADCIAQYYAQIFEFRRQDLLSKALGSRCPKPTHIPFRSYAEEFELIDSNAVAVLLAQDAFSTRELSRLRATGTANLRALQPYSFSVYSHELNALLRAGVIESLHGISILSNSDYYDPQTGVRFEGQDYIL